MNSGLLLVVPVTEWVNEFQLGHQREFFVVTTAGRFQRRRAVKLIDMPELAPGVKLGPFTVGASARASTT